LEVSLGAAYRFAFRDMKALLQAFDRINGLRSNMSAAGERWLEAEYEHTP
jgi:hypothetical protein